MSHTYSKTTLGPGKRNTCTVTLLKLYPNLYQTQKFKNCKNDKYGRKHSYEPDIILVLSIIPIPNKKIYYRWDIRIPFIVPET